MHPCRRAEPLEAGGHGRWARVLLVPRPAMPGPSSLHSERAMPLEERATRPGQARPARAVEGLPSARTSSWPSLAEPTAIQSPAVLNAREDSFSLRLKAGGRGRGGRDGRERLTGMHWQCVLEQATRVGPCGSWLDRAWARRAPGRASGAGASCTGPACAAGNHCSFGGWHRARSCASSGPPPVCPLAHLPMDSVCTVVRSGSCSSSNMPLLNPTASRPTPPWKSAADSLAPRWLK